MVCQLVQVSPSSTWLKVMFWYVCVSLGPFKIIQLRYLIPYRETMAYFNKSIYCLFFSLYVEFKFFLARLHFIIISSLKFLFYQSVERIKNCICIFFQLLKPFNNSEYMCTKMLKSYSCYKHSVYLLHEIFHLWSALGPRGYFIHK